MIGAISLVLVAMTQFAQTNTGELHLIVTDTAGLRLQASVELVNEANQFHETLETTPAGSLIVKRLAFGRYRITVTREGFAASSGTVDIRSVVPTEYRAALVVAPLQTQVTVTADTTLLDVHQTATIHSIGTATLQQRVTSLPGRAVLDLVNTQPGWLLEANGILHPRGSEYQTQYVVDGLPVTDNRSPAFAPEIDADEVHALNILTGGYPAEYGRKLGGVIEVVTTSTAHRGWQAAFGVAGGSFRSVSGSGMAAYGGERSTVSLSGSLATTDRFLDPPVTENFTNRGTTSQLAVRLERDLTTVDRLGAIVRRGQSRFLVPNERLQQEAGQRQNRASDEIAGQFSYQRILSSQVVGDVRGSLRDLSAGLWSNAASTPIIAGQDRGFRELYLKATLAGHRSIHEWKIGGDATFGRVREQFQYQITDAKSFDDDTLQEFSFADERADREQSVFVQDQLQFGAWTVSAGVRWDRYQLVVTEHALSPRLAAAWAHPAAGLVLRASYDSVFQTPASENLLLASSPALDAVNDAILRLPVRPSRGDFYEIGLTKGLFGTARVAVTHYRRRSRDAADDELLLNTGVSFPIAVRGGEITGTEVKLEVPQARRVSGFVSYSNMLAISELPITGGLFLDEEAAELLESTDRLPASQDQRHTVRGRVAYRVAPALWVALAGSFDSGLPVEFEGDEEDAIRQFGTRIVDRVDFARGRVRPSMSLDASIGLELERSRHRALRIQVDARNLTNRLNVINFAGLFSGTALASTRALTVRLQAVF